MRSKAWYAHELHYTCLVQQGLLPLLSPQTCLLSEKVHDNADAIGHEHQDNLHQSVAALWSDCLAHPARLL